MAYFDLALQQTLAIRLSPVSSGPAPKHPSAVARAAVRTATLRARLDTAFHIALRTTSIWTERYLQGGIAEVLIVLVAQAVLGGHRATDGLVPARDWLRRLVG